MTFCSASDFEIISQQSKYLSPIKLFACLIKLWTSFNKLDLFSN